MSTSSTIHEALAAKVQGLAGDIPVVARREHEKARAIAAAAAVAGGLCLLPLHPEPGGTEQFVDGVFFGKPELRVRIVQLLNVGSWGHDAYSLVDVLAQGLHWQGLEGLAHPLYLADRVTDEVHDERCLIIDVIFSAAYELRGPAVSVAVFVPQGKSAMDDLQAAALQQVQAVVDSRVPVLDPRNDRTMESRLAQTRAAVKVEVLPPLPREQMLGCPDVFYPKAALRVRVTEEPAMNDLGIDAYDVAEDVMRALHWQPLEGLLAHPLQLNPTPLQTRDTRERRVLDVLFTASFGFAAA
jgi:hypothetical protein